MAEELLTASIQAPGFSGLNIQDASVQLTSGYALEADNCVIDKYGRIGARKGWTKFNPTAIGSGPVRTIFEFVKADGNLTFACANNKIYGTPFAVDTFLEYPVGGANFYDGTYSQTGTTVTVTSVENHNLTTGDTVWFDATSGTGVDGFFVVTVTAAKIFTFTAAASATTSGNCRGINIITYTITDNNWQVASMPYGTGTTASAHAIFAQAGHPTLVIHKLGTPTHSHADGYGFQRLGDVGNLPTGYTTATFTPDCAMTSFGRLWVANIDGNNQTVYFSDLQNPSEWLTGTSGYLDISTVIPSGDGIVAIAAHNGFLIIFCHRNILIYSNAKDPANMVLQDTIKGVGCIARDSVVSVAGSDIMFLSETGVQSLGRLIQEKSMPLRDVSKNVRDDLISNVASETLKNVKAVYSSVDAFYLLSLPTTGQTYCFDTRGTLENGASRATIWNNINPTAFFFTEDRRLLLGQAGYVGVYGEYSDNGATYRMAYYTNYFDLDKPTTLKILKKIGVIAIGGSTQALTVKWDTDYTRNYDSSTIVLDAVTVAEYGIAEYNIAEYSNGIDLSNTKFNASGTGRTLQLGFESDINGFPLSIQKIDLAVKTGKLL